MKDQITLSVEDLRVYFQSEHSTAKAVDGISFKVKSGETHVLVGESGCGKSVTALAIMGLLPKYSVKIPSGKIIFDSQDLLKLTNPEMRNIRGSGISMVFQEPMTALNPVIRVGHQITESIWQDPRRALQLASNESVSSYAVKKRAIDMIAKTGLKEPDLIFNKYPHELSGGMRQRIVIAIALARRPSLIIADEPTTALDVTIQAQILSLMGDLQKETGTAILLITHDLGVVSRVGHSMSVLYAGQVVEEGRVKDVFEEPCHPYTKALFDALPSRNLNHRGKLNAIAGSVPSATSYDNLPSPCRFFERCQFQDERCFQKSSRPGHNSWCARENV
jgi:oligopeptide/dipeptide ABC transporter ATP-binding protein